MQQPHTASDDVDLEIVGLDVGGANLKYASTVGSAFSRPFPMWKNPDQLAATIARDLGEHFPALSAAHASISAAQSSPSAAQSSPSAAQSSPSAAQSSPSATQSSRAMAVTMTGELADCFHDRARGVAHIVDQVMIAAHRVSIDEVHFYGVDGKFRVAADAVAHPDLIAAANWHALAAFVARSVPADGVLIDVGSTTTDIIPIHCTGIATDAQTDHQRLCEGSLVYVGCRRTPVCALVDCLTYNGRSVPITNELFATIDDARLLLGAVPQDAADLDSADQRPRTRDCAANRMARMIGLDHRDVTNDQAVALATQVVAAARRRISESLQSFLPTSTIVISGHAADLIDVPTTVQTRNLSEELSPALARCAPSYAVAQLLAHSTRYVSPRCDA